MKKRLLILGMIACMLGLTACGSESGPAVLTEEEQNASQVATQYVEQLAMIVDQGYAEEVIAQDETMEATIDGWNNAMELLGGYEMSDKQPEVTIEKKKAIVNMEIIGSNLDPKGEKRTANVEVIFGAKDFAFSSLTVNVNYTFAELMKNAGLNTILGMGTVFAILVLISGIIACFAYIPKIQAAFAKKETKATETEAAVDNTIAQIIENEELSDDTELVAVISAAIAAYEEQQGAYVSADGVVIRSIRKVNKSKWQNA